MNFLRRSIWIVALCCSILGARADSAFLGAIPVQYVAPGEEVTLDMHRFFHAAGKEKLEVKGMDGVEASWDPATFQLRVRAGKRGLYDVPIRAGGEGPNLSTVLTLACGTGVEPHAFSFKPPGPATRVLVAGSFNGWSVDKNPMTGPNQSGEFTLRQAPLQTNLPPWDRKVT